LRSETDGAAMNFSFDNGAPHPSLAQERGRDPPSPRCGEGEEKQMPIVPQLIHIRSTIKGRNLMLKKSLTVLVMLLVGAVSSQVLAAQKVKIKSNGANDKTLLDCSIKPKPIDCPTIKPGQQVVKAKSNVKNN
jgi:hypothetical protein